MNSLATADTELPYHAPIPYNRLNRFTFVGIDEVLCCHLTRFTPDEIYRFLPLLGLHEIRFRNRFEATPEEALAVVLIRLSYPVRYWSLMDKFGHSRSWLSVIFNDTIIHLYRRFRKPLNGMTKGLPLKNYQSLLLRFIVLGADIVFGVLLMVPSMLPAAQFLINKSFTPGINESMGINSSLLLLLMCWFLA